MMCVVHLPCLKKKKKLNITLFFLWEISFGAVINPIFLSLFLWKLYIFFLGCSLWLFKTHKSNLEVSFSNKAIISKNKKTIQTKNRYFSKEDIQMANKYMKKEKASTYLIIRPTQMKTIVRYYLIQSKWPSSKSLQIIKAGMQRGYGGKYTLLYC